jgi:hypothetical protein
MKMINTLILGAAMAGLAVTANALPTIYESTTGVAGSWTAVASSADGDVSFTGSDGSIWTAITVIGQTKPSDGSAGAPGMNLQIQGTSTGAGQLWLGFADTGFADASGAFLASINGHVVSGADEGYSFITFGDTANAQPTTTLPTGSTMTTLSHSAPVGAFSAVTIGDLPASVPDTLGEIVEITASGASSTFVDASFSVPSVADGGATGWLFSAGLSGLALWKRKWAA